MYAPIDQLYAAIVPRFKEIKSACSYIKEQFGQKKSIVKTPIIARIVFLWITDNIEYDVEALLKKDYSGTAEDALRTGKAVCGQYAELFKKLCIDCGMDESDIRCSSGWAKGFMTRGETLDSNDPNHGWNVIKVGEKWYEVDTCWGSGYVEEMFDEKIPLQFVRERKDSQFLINPKLSVYQRLPCCPDGSVEPKMWEAWVSLPIVHEGFVIHNLQFADGYPNTNRPIKVAAKSITVALEADRKTCVMPNLWYQDSRLRSATSPDNLHVSGEVLDENTLRVKIFCKFDKPGRYYLVIFSGKKQAAKEHACTYKFDVADT